MLDPFRILLPTLAALFHERHDLVVENLLLRHQLQVRFALALGRTSRPGIDSSGWSFDGYTRPGGGISSSSDRRPSSAGTAEAGAGPSAASASTTWFPLASTTCARS
jgi:hypothetical protein